MNDNKITILGIIILLSVGCVGLRNSSNPEAMNKMIMETIDTAFDNLGYKFNSDTMIYNKQLLQIYDANDNIVGFGFLSIVQSCTINGCMTHSDNYNGAFEDYTLLTIYNLKHQILALNVFDYTSEYGYEITTKSWLNQFTNFKYENLVLDETIDGISGATISVNSLLNELKSHHKIRQEQ